MEAPPASASAAHEPNHGASSNAPQSNDELARVQEASSKHHAGHIGRRVFVGPMPEKIITHLEHEITRQKADTGAITLNQLETSTPEDSEDVVNVVRKHARKLMREYKVHRRENAASGSTRETRESEDDWGEDCERTVTEEMIQKWKESEWGTAWGNRRKRKRGEPKPAGPTSHWIGGSFEIGSLLGVNMLHGGHSNPYASQQVNASTANIIPRITLTEADSNTAIKGAKSSASATYGVLHQASNDSSPESPADSQMGLLPKLPQRTSSDDVQLAQESTTSLQSKPPLEGDESPLSSKDKGKQRETVHYAPDILPEASTSAPSDAPVAPMEVLERTASTVEATTSEAAMLTPVASGVEWGDVILRDRMLVRIVYSKSEGLSPKFDDSVHRTTRDLQFEGWGEYMVAWRRDLIEIYEDHRVPGRELLTGAKHLAFVIPLKSSRTTLSLYSFVDLSFCITSPPLSTRFNSNSRWILGRSKPGTNIFIFKHKSRSRSWDWIWQLWLHRGGEIPRTLNIYNPRLNTRVTVDVPFRQQTDLKGLYEMFTRDNIVALCIKGLRAVPDWLTLVEHEITEHGRRLELCWRRDAFLDWLWLDHDAFGNSRPWATIAALAILQSSRPPSLEIRLTSHAQTHYHLKNGTEIDEPPSVEGYVERIKPNTKLKQALYLSTHDGLLFTHHLDKAYPPAPPGLALTLQDLETWVTGLRQAEVQRGVNQVLHASGVCDLRNIVVVRRAFQPLVATKHDQKEPCTGDDSVTAWLQLEQEPSTLDDFEDEGGEAPLAHVSQTDRSMIRMRRSFELLLNTGHVIRFEVHSRKVALEWVNRLRALITFWKHKHKVDAKQEMELVQARRPRLTPQHRANHEEGPPEPPADMSAPYPAMENLFNWCIVEGCNPITKGGKLYMRKGLRGQYKLVQLFLVAGHLVRFPVKPGNSLNGASRKRINLLDAYVYTGYFAAMNLPRGQFQVNIPAAPRRYQDGLETDDREEDMILMVQYRSQPSMAEAGNTPTAAPVASKSVPALSMKQKVLVLKTRSRIERDAWCWALNTEIEKMVRVQKDREEKLRETGQLIDLHK